MNRDYPANLNSTNRFIGNTVLTFCELGSTNDYAKQNAANLPDGAVIIAGSQSSGRGRAGRSWLSEPNAGIYMSVKLSGNPEKKLCFYPFFSALAVCEAVKNLTGEKCCVKWPNDIIAAGRKLCGVLCETVSYETDSYCVIIGIGLNVNNISFSGELEEKAVSLRILTGGHEFNLAEAATEIMLCLDRLYSSLGEPELLRSYNSLCTSIGKNVQARIGDILVSGVAEYVDNDGALVILTPDGRKAALRSGETVVSGLY